MVVFHDAAGNEWEADMISHGHTSGYLNPRVHQPVVQFSRRDGRFAKRYTGFAETEERTLDTLSEDELRVLLDRAKPS